ncbi:leucine-rich repeat serine/threonine-protein kinase 1-like [Amphiura filiformis]|uniref:leucine-rich repeat serine/threonine-protein kinase 1-like n=1 Tax=Amphiura filiformis TaxID=82378 RepID=UPI003B21E081
MDQKQQQLVREALLDNIRQRSAKDVNQFIETLHEKERKATLFPSFSDTASQNAPRFLHEACELGKFDIFTILVNYCVNYNADIAATNSEGYSIVEFATLHGRKKFAEFLENRIGLNKLIPNSESFQRLVRISCQIGNRDMVEHWLEKMTECLNRPLNSEDFVSGIDPVTEAFKAGHHDLACDLFKRNIVKITESMYVQTRTFLSERLHELVEEVDGETVHEAEHQMYRAQWHSKSIWFFHFSWLQTSKIQSVFLKTIDLSSNHLETIPEELLWSLPHLEYLLLNQNDLISLPPLPSNLTNIVERSLLLKLDVSDNKLVDVPVDIFVLPKMRTLDVSHNYIHRLPHDLTSDGPEVYSLRCRSLTTLDVSHNQLGTLPLWMTRCAMLLTSLNISNNKMETLLPSWKCSLECLDASHNNISEMAVCDFHTHWAHSLTNLNLSHNDFTEIPNTVCQLTLLNILDISRNAISYLPPEHLWTTRHLTKLNLTGNKLMCNYEYEDSKRSSVTSTSFYTDLVLPKVIHNSLKQLFLGSNQLRSVPESVCEMRELAVLDLSRNKDLHRLPYAMSRLRKLFSLRLNKTPISEPREIVPVLNNPPEMLQKLRETFENFRPYHQVKVVVAGPRSAGKTTLVRSLWDSEAPLVGLDTGKPIDIVNREFKHHVGLSTLQRTLNLRGETLYRDIAFNVWDLKGGESLELIHRCCVTPNTIYMLVWDLNGDINEIEKLLPWWLTIKSVASGSQVILVGTHKNSTRRNHNKMVEFLKQTEDAIKTKFQEDMKICYVDTSTTSRGQPQKHGFSGLENVLVRCVNKLSYQCRGSSYSFSKLMIPESFLLLKGRITTELTRMQEIPDCPRIITESDIQTYVSEIPNSCLQTEDDLYEVLDFLNYTGSFIHVSDRKYGLGRLYFPDPSWLCDVVTSITDLPQSALEVSGKITKVHLKRLCQKSGFGKEKFKEFEQLLKSFEIIMPSSDDDATYWIPCKLPHDKPAIEFRHEGSEPKQLRRVYKLPYIPPGFWIRLVSRIITSVEQRKRNSAFQKPRSRTLSSSGLQRTHSMVEGYRQGGDFSNVYWQTGILVFHETGELLVEDLAATYITSFRSDEEKIGVCVTVKCRLGRFSIMGLVVDEIESLISNWYPDLGCSQMYRLIPCPICEHQVSYRERSDSGRRRSDPTRIISSHLFAVEDLGTKVCKTLDETVECPNHKDEKVILNYVIPEMFLDDLDVTILSEERFRFRQKKKFKLGSGGFGDVYRGTYDDKTVAVKCFAKQARPQAVSLLPPAMDDIDRQIKTEPVKMRHSKMEMKKPSITNLKRRFSSLGVHSKVMFKGKSTKGTSTEVHTVAGPELKRVDETSNISAEKLSSSTSGSITGTFDPEVINSFSKLRNELAVMCQLHHPYIISLIGASLQSLCFAMEYAPLGDLNTLLQEKHDFKMAKLPIGE